MLEDKFNRDLKEGEYLEKYLLEYFKEKYPDIRKMQGYFKEFDLISDDAQVKIEVKTDTMSKQTGNVAIEVWLGRKPSGILTSEATHWAFGYYNGKWKILVCKTEALKRQVLLFGKKRVIGGDNNASTMRLLSVNDLERTFGKVIEMPEDLIKDILGSRYENKKEKDL